MQIDCATEKWIAELAEFYNLCSNGLMEKTQKERAQKENDAEQTALDEETE